MLIFTVLQGLFRDYPYFLIRLDNVSRLYKLVYTIMSIADFPFSCRKHPPFKTRLLRQMIAGCATTGIFAVTPSAQAVGLGEAVSHSNVGDLFRAEVPLLIRAGEQIEEGCIQLAQRPQDDLNDLPWISSGRIAIRQTGKGATIIVSARPVQHPAVMFGIVVNCGASLRRDYTLLLDPPTTTQARLPADAAEARSFSSGTEATQAELGQRPPHYWISNPGDTLNGIARRLYPHSAATQRRYVELQLASGKLPASSTGQSELEAGTRLEILPVSALRPSVPPPQPKLTPEQPPLADTPPAPRVARPAAPRNRVIIGTGSENSLRLSTALNQRPEMSEAERSQLKKELQLIAALDDKNAEHIELLARVKQLEALQTRLEADAARLQAQLALVQSTAAGVVAPHAGVSTPVNTAGTVPASISAPVSHDAGDAPVAKPKAWYQKPYALTGLLGLLAALVAIGILWMQRRKLNAEENSRELFPPNELADPQSRLPAPVPVEGDPLMEPLSEADIWPDAVDASATLNARSLEGASAHLSTNAPTTLMQVDGEDEHNSAIELAEIMMSFGRVQGAAQTLADFIRANPKQAVKPWMKLLEVYRVANMQMEFEALTAQLNKTFNVQPVLWDDFDITRNAQDSLESHDHIRLQLCTLWGTPACQAYLHHLLRDNRQGTRQGFPLAIIDEILLLLGILEHRLGPYRPTPPAAMEPPHPPQNISTELQPPAAKPATAPAATPLMPPGSAIQPLPPQEMVANLDFDLIDMNLLSKTLHINLDELSQLPTTTKTA